MRLRRFLDIPSRGEVVPSYATTTSRMIHFLPTSRCRCQVLIVMSMLAAIIQNLAAAAVDRWSCSRSCAQSLQRHPAHSWSNR